MKKSLSKYLWKEVDNSTCNINVLKDFKLDTAEKARECLRSAFFNCLKRKSCSQELAAQFDRYKSMWFEFIQTEEAQTHFLDRSIELNTLARDTYYNNVGTEYYQSQLSNKRRKIIEDDGEDSAQQEASASTTSASTPATTPATTSEDVWSYFKTLLSLGKDNESYHKYSALRNGIILLGEGIKPQRGVNENIYSALQQNLLQKDGSFSYTSTSRAYLEKILATNTLKEFELKIRCLPEGPDPAVILSQDILFAILNLIKNMPKMEKVEKNYADSFMKPLMDAVANTKYENLCYENREAALLSINHILKRRYLIKDNSEGYKADGILRYQDHEILLVELCGPYKSTSRSKVQFDRHKGMYGVLGMLKYISEMYCYGSLATFSKLKIFFIHTKECELQLWSIQFIHDMFFFQRVTTCVVSENFKSKATTFSNLMTFISTVLNNIDSTIGIIDELVNEHGHTTSAITLGVADASNTETLKKHVKPVIRHLTEKKDSPGLYLEDPISFDEDDD